ncbi:MAG: 4'-phosphopantetheinyl transferase superfamily protein, partial [Bacteroidota bacterium]
KIKGHRRIEWLAARQLVHQMSGRQNRAAFVKDEFGKPHLEDAQWEISISHSRDISAAIAAPVAVGIDVQKVVPKITRIIPKFMNAAEQANLDQDHSILHTHVYWGAKEALYKAYGRRALDLCTHIQLHPFSYQTEQGKCKGIIQKEDYQQAFQIRYQLLPQNYMLVYAWATDNLQDAPKSDVI